MNFMNVFVFLPLVSYSWQTQVFFFSVPTLTIQPFFDTHTCFNNILDFEATCLFVKSMHKLSQQFPRKKRWITSVNSILLDTIKCIWFYKTLTFFPLCLPPEEKQYYKIVHQQTRSNSLVLAVAYKKYFGVAVFTLFKRGSIFSRVNDYLIFI